MGCTGNDDPARRAGARRVGVKQAHTVQRPRLNAEIFPACGQTEMQYRVRTKRLLEVFEFLRGSRKMNWQERNVERDAEARQPCFMICERADEPRRRVVAGARKAAEAGHENAQWPSFHRHPRFHRFPPQRSHYRHFWRRQGGAWKTA